jgi:hypothetical protein
MNKFKHITILCAAAFALAGCFAEDHSFCPPESIAEPNVRFDFRVAGSAAFNDVISTVNVSIFDDGGNYIETRHVESVSDIELVLQRGDYRFVFWGNMSGNTKFEGMDAAAPRITYSDNNGPVVTADADKLYYAPHGVLSRAGEGPQSHFALTVTGPQMHSNEVWFGHAHRSLNIFVEGLAEPPVVDIEGLPAGHGVFGRGRLDETVTVSHETEFVEKESKRYAAASFDTFYFDDTEGIYIVVRSTAGTELYRISLADAMAEVGSDPAQINIDLIISFINGNVRVTLPAWSGGETGVDLD